MGKICKWECCNSNEIVASKQKITVKITLQLILSCLLQNNKYKIRKKIKKKISGEVIIWRKSTRQYTKYIVHSFSKLDQPITASYKTPLSKTLVIILVNKEPGWTALHPSIIYRRNIYFSYFIILYVKYFLHGYKSRRKLIPVPNQTYAKKYFWRCPRNVLIEKLIIWNKYSIIILNSTDLLFWRIKKKCSKSIIIFSNKYENK